MKRLADVPFKSLQPGDVVYVHATSGGYHESFQLMNSGTERMPIRIVGVNDPRTGEKAALDGSNAVAGPSVTQGYYTYLFPYGGIIISPAKGFRWGDAPSHLSIENLEIRNFNMRNTMTNPSGKVVNWDRFACGIYCERVRQLTVKNCSIHHNGNGFFANSKYGAAADSRDILIDHNTFNFNGNPGTYSEHHLYSEANGITIQNNTFGPLIDDSHGCGIKDRSAGTVIRYNSIIGSPHGVAVMLVGPQGGSGYIENLPTYKKTYFYGNVLHNPPADIYAHNPPADSEAFVMYGGDSDYAQARRGTLYAYQNTFIQKADSAGSRRSAGNFCFWLPNMVESKGLPIEETVDCRNNVFYAQSETPGLVPASMTMLYTGGAAHFDFGKNWLSPTVKPYQIARGGPFPLPVMTGIQNLMFDSKNNPGLTDPRAGYGANDFAPFRRATDNDLMLALVDPYFIPSHIDPNLLLPAVDIARLAKLGDPNLLLPAVNVPKLRTLIDPSYFYGSPDWAFIFATVDPNIMRSVIDANLLIGLLRPVELGGFADPTDVVGALDPTVLFSSIDLNFLIGLLDPISRPGITDPYARPAIGSPLVGIAGPLSADLPANLLPTFERYGFGKLRARSQRTLSLGAFELMHNSPSN